MLAAEKEALSQRVADAARGRLLVHAKEAANTALPRIKDRFNDAFNRDDAGMPQLVAYSRRGGGGRRSTPLRGHLARPALCGAPWCAANGKEGGPDAVEAAIGQLMDASSGSAGGAGKAKSMKPTATSAPGFDILSATHWPGVAAGDVLLPPGAARTIWRQFWSDSALAVQQALATRGPTAPPRTGCPPLGHHDHGGAGLQ